MTKRNILYAITALFITGAASFVWYQYFNVSASGLSQEDVAKVESKFLLSVETEYDRYQLAIDAGKFDALNVGESTELEVRVDADSLEKLDGMELILSYNSAVIKVTAIRNGTIFQYYLEREVAKERGVASIAAAVQVLSAIESGDNLFATLTVQRLAEGDPELKTKGLKDESSDELVSKVIEIGQTGSFPIASQEF